MEVNKIYQGDCIEVLKTLPEESINCIMTSPPYWSLRDYGIKGQLGLESTFQEYIKKLCDIFDGVKRVLRKDGTCWVNIGDTYIGNGVSRHKGWSDPKNPKKGEIDYDEPSAMPQNIIEKNLANIPARFSIEMQERGWILRNVIIWHKPNAMPCSVKDRFTVDFEYLFLFTKNKIYAFNQQLEVAVEEYSPERAKRPETSRMKAIHSSGKPAGNFTTNKLRPDGMKNMRSVWKINTLPCKEAHFATYPEALCDTPIKAGCPEKGIVLDPFFGAGTTGIVALKQDKKFIGIELNPKYIEIANKRLKPYLEQHKLISADFSTESVKEKQ